MQRYYAVIDTEAGADYGVSFPDFPGCFSAGRTTAQAIDNAAEALELHVDGMKEDGDPIPAPTPLEDILRDPEWRGGAVILVGGPKPRGKAKRVSVTFDEHLLADIDRAAKAEGLSRAAFLAVAAEGRIVSRD